MTDSAPRSAVTSLRHIALIEGISFLLLLFVAMPLKYFAELPQAVRVVGWLHGVLFMAFLFVWVLAWPRLPVRWIVLSFVGAVVPFGPFFVDRHLKVFEENSAASPGGT